MQAMAEPDYEHKLLEQTRVDPRAFERLYCLYFPRVYAYVTYQVGGVEDSEDLVSEVFLKAVEAIGQGRFEWRHDHSFAAWLFRLAHNAVSDCHRRNRRQGQTLTLSDIERLVAELPPPEDGLLKREEQAQLYKLVAGLSPRRQEIITLKFFGGLRNQEIATVLSLDERTVASHLCRGLEDLQHKYRSTEL